jgi:uncharacterized membrane protein
MINYIIKIIPKINTLEDILVILIIIGIIILLFLMFLLLRKINKELNIMKKDNLKRDRKILKFLSNKKNKTY